eukprot:1142307-Pelagomonas_calceolata.AAC.4
MHAHFLKTCALLRRQRIYRMVCCNMKAASSCLPAVGPKGMEMQTQQNKLTAPLRQNHRPRLHCRNAEWPHYIARLHGHIALHCMTTLYRKATWPHCTAWLHCTAWPQRTAWLHYTATMQNPCPGCTAAFRFGREATPNPQLR